MKLVEKELQSFAVFVRCLSTPELSQLWRMFVPDIWSECSYGLLNI